MDMRATKTCCNISPTIRGDTLDSMLLPVDLIQGRMWSGVNGITLPRTTTIHESAISRYTISDGFFAHPFGHRKMSPRTIFGLSVSYSVCVCMFICGNAKGLWHTTNYQAAGKKSLGLFLAHLIDS